MAEEDIVKSVCFCRSDRYRLAGKRMAEANASFLEGEDASLLDFADMLARTVVILYRRQHFRVHARTAPISARGCLHPDAFMRPDVVIAFPKRSEERLAGR